MKPGVSRIAWMGLGGSATLCAAIILASRQFRPVKFAGNPVLTALLAEKTSLQVNDGTRDALRRQWTQMQEHAWTPATVADLQAELGSAWRCDSADVPDGSWLKPITLSRATVPMHEWTTLSALIERLEKKPGVVVTALDLAAEGMGSARQFRRVTLTLGVVWQSATARHKERAPDSSALRVPATTNSAVAGSAGAAPFVATGADSPRERRSL